MSAGDSSIDAQGMKGHLPNNTYAFSFNGQYATAGAVEEGLMLTNKASSGLVNAQKWIFDGSMLMPMNNSNGYAGPSSTVADGVPIILNVAPYIWTLNHNHHNNSVTIRVGDGTYLFWSPRGQYIQLADAPIPWTLEVVS